MDRQSELPKDNRGCPSYDDQRDQYEVDSRSVRPGTKMIQRDRISTDRSEYYIVPFSREMADNKIGCTGRVGLCPFRLLRGLRGEVPPMQVGGRRRALKQKTIQGKI